MNRARYREVDAKMRRLTRRMRCDACDPSTHLLEEITEGADGGVGKYAGMASAVGVALSIPLIATATGRTDAPAIVRRASTLAGVIGLVVSERPREEWYAMLSRIANQRVAASVQAMMPRLKGVEAADALMISLTFVFLQGAVGEKLGQADEVTLGYRRALAALDTALENIRRQSMPQAPVPTGSTAGLAGLGALSGVIDEWITNNLGTAFDWVITALGKLGRAMTDLLCRGFRALFTGPLEPVGGVLCTIVQLTLGGAVDTIRSGAAILKAIFLGLAAFFANLFKGEVKAAAEALVVMVNTIVVTLLGGSFSSILGIPVVDAELTEAQKADGVKSLEGLGRELPGTFTLMLIASVLGIVFGGPTPVSVSSLIVSLTPAIVVIVAPAVKRTPRFRNLTVAKIKAGLEAIVKIAAMVVAQVMSLADTFKKFATAIQKYADRLKKDAPGEAKKLLAAFASQFPTAWNNFMAKIQVGNIVAGASGVRELLRFVPELLIAIAETDPDLKDISDTTREIIDAGLSTYEKAKKIWNEAVKDAPTTQEKIRLLRETIDTARRDLDVQCGGAPGDPNCKFPNEQQTEKIVTVYKDCPAGGPNKGDMTRITAAKCPVPKKKSSTSSAGMLAAVAALGIGLGYVLRKA